MKSIVCLILVLTVVVSSTEKFRYDGYQLIRIFPSTPKQLELVEEYEKDSQFDIWNSIKEPVKSVDVLLSPNAFAKYRPLFVMNQIPFDVLDENIQRKFDEQEKSMIRTKDTSSILFKYARYTEILNFVDQTVSKNSDIASSYIAGKSHENRLLKVIILKPNQDSTRSIWIDCGIHAREWVSAASCVYIIDKLIDDYRANDPTTKAIFKKYEIHIMPLVNPDGYEYSWSTYRMWRKNKRANSGSSCLGVDLNRNFGYKWRTGGSSTSPCSDIYAGPQQDSEPETMAIENALKKKKDNWDAYLNLHTYGNWWLLPWGYSKDEKPTDLSEMISKGQVGVDAIKDVNGETFTIGTSADLLYVNSGSSKDWAKGELDIKYSYVLELAPGSNSPDYIYGFALPENRMKRVAPETYAGVKAFISSIV